MLFSKIFRQKGLGFPYVSLGLVLSCVVISLPLFFSSEFYFVLGGGAGVNIRFWQVITSRFAHGGGMPLLPHLLANLIAFAFFGVVIERVLGSGRFFALSLAAFSAETVWRVVVNQWGNGASGICWGYLVFIWPILVWIWQKSKRQAFKDYAYVLAIGYALFMLFGLPILIWTSGVKSNSNFIHFMSILAAFPFFLLWRKILFRNLEGIAEDQRLDRGNSTWNKAAVATSITLLLFNVIVSTGVIASLITYSCETCPQVVSITPPNGNIETLNVNQQRIAIRFNKPMEPKLYNHGCSIYSHDEKGPLDFSFDWIDTETLAIQFSREVYPGERIEIKIDSLKGTDGLWSYQPIELKYE